MTKQENKRKKPSPNKELVLFGEVNSCCPKCHKPLMVSNKGNYTKIYEIAHIYPHSPRPDEAELLKGEERLNTDSDHVDNLIALCRDCHKIFDNPRTIEGYREMVSIKKELIRNKLLKEKWFSNKIDEEIDEVISELSSYNGSSLEKLSMEALRVDDKSDETLNNLIKLKIKNNVVFFYTKINFKFSELDKITPYTSETIYSQVKTYYVSLKKDKQNQTQIFNTMTEWIKNTTNCKSIEVAEIMVSFFIQNCEVYS
ncbi:HNH endonuclease [Photobacterium phosphoreum]|uniref:ABC-three component system protein n=1 Tax=Photobacterium phosphoreum TaxID=659 RepID=UPI000D164FD3|nr:ABC-three component system protein [Photobacterium phosphoreum]PSU68280.1 HNH endonuclease [Photobacterium phosphoreum]